MPKIVVFYDGYNDVGLLCDRGIADSLNSTAKDISMRAKMSEREKHDGLYVNLVAPIVALAIEVNQSDVGANQFSCGKNKERAELVAETMVRNWEIARTLVEANGGRFFAFLQPNAFVGHPRTDYMPDGVSERWRIREQATPDFTAVYPLIRAKLAARASTWATDVTDAFDGDEMFYIDSVHVVPKGNAIIAKRMFERITHATQQAAN
jgi:hypothetical protein